MTTLAADSVRDFQIGDVAHYPVIASDIIYEGAAVGLDGSGDAQPLTASDIFAGFAQRKVDNSAGAAGAKKVAVLRRGRVKLTVTGADATKVGDVVYATDDNAFTLTKALNAVPIGRIDSHVTSTTVWVKFDAATEAGAGVTDPTDLATCITAISAVIDRLEDAGVILATV